MPTWVSLSIAARLFYPRARIHSYEPNPRVLSYLEQNTASLDIEVFPEAVGQKREQHRWTTTAIVIKRKPILS